VLLPISGLLRDSFTFYLFINLFTARNMERLKMYVRC
jgi:hypothetical protein